MVGASDRRAEYRIAFAAFSYVAPLITEVSGLSSGLMTPLLMLFGLGLVAGNLIGGHYADRAQVATLLTAQAALFLTLVTFAFMAGSPAMAFILLPLIGGTGFATVPGFMTRVIDRAKEAPTLAAAVASAAANAGIALGSYLAGIVVDAGLGFTAPLLVGAAMAAVALCRHARFQRAGASFGLRLTWQNHGQISNHLCAHC